ncbi:MAG: hypothetical protein NZ519_02395 [Bacteroidia bacterium]|nr:hypothetical protein [Bacteroidia bacterium]MDW8302928.1 hypothetical protein [Bacteroidia bacterium]
MGAQKDREDSFLIDFFLGVPLANARVGLLRTTLRYGATLTLRTA